MLSKKKTLRKNYGDGVVREERIIRLSKKSKKMDRRANE